MNKEAKALRALRDRVKDIRSLSGSQTTNDLVAAFDATWRTLLAIRINMVRRLRREGTIESSSEFRAWDFAALFHTLVEGEGTICGECLTEIAAGSGTCTICGASLQDEDLDEQLDIEVPGEAEKADFDLDYEADPILAAKAPERLPMLKPITKKDLIPGPKGPKKKRRKLGAHKKSEAAVAMFRWSRRKEFGRGVPYSFERLEKFPIQDLKAIAVLIPEYEHSVVVAMNRTELTRWILGHQGDSPIDPGPPPFGEIPTIEKGTL